MILLTSNGLSSPELIGETARHVRANGKAAIITTASVGYKERDWNIPRLVQELDQLEISSACFDVEFEDPELLLQYDVVEIKGGNPFYLLHQLRLRNAEDVLRKIGQERILIGTSAGSIVLQESIELIAQYSPEMNDEVQLTDFTGLSLTDVEVLPHYDRMMSRFDRFEERVQEYERKSERTVIRINDGEGVLISNENPCKIITFAKIDFRLNP